MPRKRNSSPPPPVMTWKKVSWVLVIAGVSDVLRYMFLFFWFFAPALAIAYCSAEVNGPLTTWTAGLLGAKTAELACSTGVVGATVGAAVITGGLSAAAIQAFGTVMAMAVGFAGWLAVTIIIFATDRRTLGRNPITVLWMLEGLGASVLVMALGVYKTQIKTERAAFAKWKKENADAELQQRREQEAKLMQSRVMQQQELNNELEGKMLQQEEDQETGGGELNKDEEVSEAETSTPQSHIQLQPVPSQFQERARPTQSSPIHEYGPRKTPSPSTLVPNHIGETRSPEKGDKINTARREFFKKAGALVGTSVAGAYVPSLAFAETKGSVPYDLENKTYEQGIETLRKDALFEKNERVEMFAVKRGAAGKWINIPESETTRGPTSVSYSYDVIDKAVYGKDIERVDVVHTHPLMTISRDAELVSRIQKGDAEPLAMPPSLTDIMNLTIGRNQRNTRGAHKLGEVVVDPAGVWRAEIGDNPKSLLLARKTADESESLVIELQEQDDVKRFGISGKDPRHLFLDILVRHAINPATFSKKTGDILEGLKRNFQELSKDPEMSSFISKIETVPGGHNVLDDPKKLEEIKAIYKDIGVNLTFTPHARTVRP